MQLDAAGLKRRLAELLDNQVHLVFTCFPDSIWQYLHCCILFSAQVTPPQLGGYLRMHFAATDF